MGNIKPLRNLIGGELRSAQSGAVLESINPATGEVWTQIPKSDAADVEAAVEAAAEAFGSWSSLPAGFRASAIEKVADIFKEHGEELATLESTDNGNLIEVSKLMNGVGLEALWKRAANDTLPATTGQSVVLDPNTIGFTLREPYGVFGVIVPYNMPIAMFSNKVSLALAAGNTVVAKPPEQASAGVLRFAEYLAEIFPPGVVNVVSGLGDVGDAIVRHHACREGDDDGIVSDRQADPAFGCRHPHPEHLRARRASRPTSCSPTPTWMPPPSGSPSRRCTPSTLGRRVWPAPAYSWSAPSLTR